MANTNINIRMDADLKRQFEAFCADMGMTMTTAFNVFARKAVREYRIPFEISGDVPNAETVEAIQEVKRMKADPSLGKTYSNVDQMMEELLADVYIRPTTKFQKDLKRVKKRGFDISLLTDIIKKLAAGEPLPEKNREHQLYGDYTGCRECHITPDWLLIYEVDGDELILYLTRTGSHSDLF